MTIEGLPVVTGMGMLSSLGGDAAANWDNLCAGQRGFRPVTLFDTAKFRSPLGGEVEGEYPRTGKERMAAFGRQALIEALQSAGLSADELDMNKTAIVVGTSLGHLFENEEGAVPLDEFMPIMLKAAGLQVPYFTLSTACSSGSDSVAIGMDLIAFMQYDVVLCGGIDVLDKYKMSGHSSLQTQSPTACTPFSIHTDGTTLGEGAAFLVLESGSHAQRRGARPLARAAGRSSTTDTQSVTAPDETGGGAIRAIRQALAQSDYEPDQVAYVNAHGSGTPTNDAMEAVVYDALFKNEFIPVSSTKAAVGHTLGATGTLEAVVTVQALLHHEAPPTAGLDEVAAAWSGANTVKGEAAAIRSGGPTLSVTYGFGGANTCLVFDAFRPQEEESV
ncbi:Beta-ketoacyl synthase [Paenibacillus curdlanolyticus YK9]|uniref:Beta-ketoacyl synthase n=1 Tax=Paenibacillus curdlanolyticus YK9 TaxID=717606 RepID=E0I8M7_9BACL|nr:beta-ketoacyl-[acyl-carrier-protein] synthase family protein [Paenibacillus curdlanolyticus]EFM11532.1 Beta-ketoacyl synthase [Paenibacillus curdlanolyticus YK9]